MDSERLVDLDELTLRCKSESAQRYIKEAVASYKAGALRSAIVSAWIAVAFDFIDKLRELSLAGHKDAKAKITEFETIRQSNDLKKSLEFERGLLDSAKDEFEFLTNNEYLDLSRLFLDRHRCAHPSMNTEDEIYQPTPELARTHIRNAVTHLLQNPPAQGKVALDWLTKDIESPYFPNDEKSIYQVLSQGPLGRARASLVRNFVVYTLETLLLGQPAERIEMRYKSALMLCRELYPDIVDMCLRDKLTAVINRVDLDNYWRIIDFVYDIDDTWQYISVSDRLKLDNYVRDMPPRHLQGTFYKSLRFAPTEAAALFRLRSMSKTHLGWVCQDFQEGFPDEMCDRIIDVWKGAPNYTDAMDTANRLILPYISKFAKEKQRGIVAASECRNVLECYAFEDVLEAVKEKGDFTLEELESLFDDCGLSDRFARLLSTEDAEAPIQDPSNTDSV